MLNKSVMDKLVPLPTEEDILSTYMAKLQAERCPITNLKSGGVFYSLMRIWIRAEIALIGLVRGILSNLFLSSADDADWLELAAADFAVFRKAPLKTSGLVTLTRTGEAANNTIKLKKGEIFRTELDITGNELRFFSTAETVFPAGLTQCNVPVEAELAGKAYNLPSGKLTRSLSHLEGVTDISNRDGWITREGADIEELEAFRSRVLNIWSELAKEPTAGKYRSVCEAVPGVLHADIIDDHPRGQGTVDIVVTSTAGEATDALLDAVRAAAETVRGPYDNLLVKSAVTVKQNITVNIVVAKELSDEGFIERATAAIRGLYDIRWDRSLNELFLSDIIVAIKSELPTTKNILVTEPAADVSLDSGNVIVIDDVAVTIERV